MQEKEVFLTDNFYPKAKSIDIKRLLYAIETLLNEGKIRSYKHLAEKAGYSSQDFTYIKTGRKSLQMDFLYNISKISSINKSWVLTGDGEMLKNNDLEIQKKDKSDNITLSREVFDLIKNQAEAILSQQKTIETLASKVKDSTVPREGNAMNADAAGFSDK